MRIWFRTAFYLYIFIGFSISSAGAYEDFFKAVALDSPQMVKGLLERGFDPNTLDPKGQSALFLAMREDSPKVAAALLAHPGIRDDQANSVGETPLMMAALKGRLEWAQRLVDRGARVDKDGWTPLHYAATGPEPRVVSLLLERGARPDPLAPSGATPLMLAARQGAIDAVPLLLEHGADPRLRDQRGLSAADYARAGGRDALAAKLDALTRPRSSQ